VMTSWARRKFGITGLFGDHSGLGPKTRITAAEMMAVMIQARRDPVGRMLHDLVKDHGLPDAAGKAQDKAAVRVHAKSGTMNFVSNLSGYIDAGDRELAFAIFSGDLPRREAVPIWDREDPKGDAAWVKRARRLQGQLLHRWGTVYL